METRPTAEHENFKLVEAQLEIVGQFNNYGCENLPRVGGRYEGKTLIDVNVTKKMMDREREN